MRRALPANHPHGAQALEGEGGGARGESQRVDPRVCQLYDSGRAAVVERGALLVCCVWGAGYRYERERGATSRDESLLLVAQGREGGEVSPIVGVDGKP
jgi:hypothetical protein